MVSLSKRSALVLSLAIITSFTITACSTKKMTKQEEYKKKQEDLAKKKKEDQEKRQKDWKKKQEDFAKKKKDERERQKDLAAQALNSWKGYEDEREKLVSALVNAEEDDAKSRERDTPKPMRLSKKTAAIQPVQNVSYNSGENASNDSGGCMSSFWSGVETVNEVMPYVQQGAELAQQYDQLNRRRSAPSVRASSSSSGSSSNKSSNSSGNNQSNSQNKDSNSQGRCCDIYKDLCLKALSDCRACQEASRRAENFRCPKTNKLEYGCDEERQLRRESQVVCNKYQDSKMAKMSHHNSCQVCRNSSCSYPSCNY
ncbi:MAG: hypothetical protein MUD12_12245 [Spirochaetes bacterium]|nr:hypothetical protein [Spirochaetota bacterium]